MDAIAIEHVSKQFSRRGESVTALEDVSLCIRSGEIFGLLGPNGAGKTTLINCAVRVVRPDAGRVLLFGKDVERHPAVLERLNLVSAQSSFHWSLAAQDVLEFFGRSYALPARVAKRRIAELMAFFGIADLGKRPIGDLSTGERMRLSFAKAMINRPELLLLDEPTLGLDPDIARKVRAEVLRVNRAFGTTIVLTSHYMQEVEQLCHRVAFINRGRIVDTGTVAELKRRLFSTETLVIEVERPLPALRRLGFAPANGRFERTLRPGEDVVRLLSAVRRTGTVVRSVTTLKPTLEDYFVQVLHQEGASFGE